MRAFPLIIIFSLTHLSGTAQSELRITVTELRSVKGNLMIGLFDNAGEFPKKATFGQIVPITGDSVSVVFSNLKARAYAVSVIHDENANGKLDTNFFGIPKEGFAFGNNSIGIFGPPSFEKAEVIVGHGLIRHVLVIRYY